MNKELRTERLLLVPANNARDDAPFLDMLGKDGDFRLFSGVEMTEKNLLAFHNYFERKACCYYAIFLKDYPEKMIGYVGISYRGQERTEAEFYVSKPYRNHGYCTEALHKVCEEAFLGNLKWRNEEGKEVCPAIDKLYATTIADNLATVKVLEKYGFSKNTEIAFGFQVLIDPDNEDVVYNNEISEYELLGGKSGHFYITGDCHGDFIKIAFFCKRHETCKNDFMIILGDSGINYWADSRDEKTKRMISALPISFFVVHGNHEERASELSSYREKSWHGGIVYYEEKFPDILFAKDGEIYDFNGKKGIVIGGAYSLDKDFRIDAGLPWYKSEQPSVEIKTYVETKLKNCGWTVDFVFSHTCPSSLEPKNRYLEYIDQSKVDKMTEEWLEQIHDRLQYEIWYFGHFHENQQSAHAVMLFEEIRELGADSFLQRVGRPKYKVGDRVLFYPDEERDYAGTIVIVDAYGTFCNPTQVYYDIEMQNGSWYKHVPESLVEKIEDIKAGRDVE